MKPFQKFIDSFDQKKFDYDARRFGGEWLNEIGNKFSDEQYRFLVNSLYYNAFFGNGTIP